MKISEIITESQFAEMDAGRRGFLGTLGKGAAAAGLAAAGLGLAGKAQAAPGPGAQSSENDKETWELAYCAGVAMTAANIFKAAGRNEQGEELSRMSKTMLNLSLNAAANRKDAMDTAVKANQKFNDKYARSNNKAAVIDEIHNIINGCTAVATAIMKDGRRKPQSAAKPDANQSTAQTQIQWNSKNAYAIGYLVGQASKHRSNMDSGLVQKIVDLEKSYNKWDHEMAKKGQGQVEAQSFDTGQSNARASGYNPTEIQTMLNTLSKAR